MRALVQRVTSASVEVDGQEVARIGLALGKSRTFTERHNGVPPV